MSTRCAWCGENIVGDGCNTCSPRGGTICQWCGGETFEPLEEYARCWLCHYREAERAQSWSKT